MGSGARRRRRSGPRPRTGPCPRPRSATPHPPPCFRSRFTHQSRRSSPASGTSRAPSTTRSSGISCPHASKPPPRVLAASLTLTCPATPSGSPGVGRAPYRESTLRLPRMRPAVPHTTFSRASTESSAPTAAPSLCSRASLRARASRASASSTPASASSANSSSRTAPETLRAASAARPRSRSSSSASRIRSAAASPPLSPTAYFIRAKPDSLLPDSFEDARGRTGPTSARAGRYGRRGRPSPPPRVIPSLRRGLSGRCFDRPELRAGHNDPAGSTRTRRSRPAGATEVIGRGPSALADGGSPVHRSCYRPESP